MDSATLANWATALIAIVALAVSIISASRKGLEAKFDRLSTELNEQREISSSLAGRISGVERDIQHLPDLSATHRIELTMSELSAKIAVISEQLKPVAATSSRLQEFLLEQAKGR
jgi:septal ring factor EnvC (AmiA/AmiB activator)